MSDIRTGVSDAPVTPRSPGSWDARSAAALAAPVPAPARIPEPVRWPEPAGAAVRRPEPFGAAASSEGEA
ncbi:hypothetical protein [Streptomyces cavernicola]|uniref:Uncharacterized protein n=1 Tax=Streptomyces cavernicola TaxID=3043613 RepID=A0ABT6SHS6_9ACTN|nr:hypothetical protein [Streptomyces sp. B-S-A6]MDI3407751.1 hypothetical protein [Streptomyces sp. B-S-A6]